MARKQFIAACGLILVTFALMLSHPALAMPSGADSASDLIDAVNTLRASYGLPPYNPNPILMYTAQAHAEYMATTGNVTHYGPGGISVTGRLLAAGYPLAGDLSLGGFRSENIIGGNESLTALEAVNEWTGDAPHLNTMISASLTEIGAGVALANGRVYYVIDCALPTSSGVLPPTVGGTIVPSSNAAAIPPVVQSTPNENGEVVYEVQAGQTLWQIAIAYNVRIDDIKRLNNLSDNTIYPGDDLLIQREVVQSTVTPGVFPTFTQTISPTPLVTMTAMSFDATSTQATTAGSFDRSGNNRVMSFVIALVALAMLAGGYIAWRGEPNA